MRRAYVSIITLGTLSSATERGRCQERSGRNEGRANFGFRKVFRVEGS